MRYYTGRGDSGNTDSLGCGRIAKDDCVAVSVGDVDELNCAIGLAASGIADKRLSDMLTALQDRLFIVGAQIASGAALSRKISRADVEWIEGNIQILSSDLPEQKKFVLPGGSQPGAQLHLARAVARRAERSIVTLSKNRGVDKEVLAFINRLSSFLFVAALFVNKKEGVAEKNPTYD